jgi:hypothetical protein
MNACAVWLADDFLIRDGWTIVDRGDRRTAIRDGRTFVIPGVCRCPAEDCPPHRVEPVGVAA